MTEDAQVGILVVAFNAATTLHAVMERIPEEVRPRIAHVLVSDDHSSDDTYEVGLEVQSRELGMPVSVVRQPRNLGYGGNQKFGYRWAIAHGLDVIVMLHGDGQYAPEEIARLFEPIVAGDADVVMGSRMLVPGAARAGGMPRYKYVGNRILTSVQNSLSGLELSEWHSGYRAFSTRALAQIPFERNSDGFDFDTEVLLQLHDVGSRIVEVPIPTYYGDEICYVAGVPYARDVVVDVLRYRAQRIGLGGSSLAVAERSYDLKPSEGSSHRRLADRARARPPGRALDLGCGDGYIGELLAAAGHHVTGVDARHSTLAKEKLDRFVHADLDAGLPQEVLDDAPYDLVMAADVLEHLRDPAAMLRALHGVLRPGGVLLVSVPNFGHWYPRLRVVAGRFDYDRRGILDEDHVRFFTRRGFERLVRQTGWHVLDADATGLPFDVADRGGAGGWGATLQRTFGRLDHRAVQARPTLFGYQLLYELEPSLQQL